MSLTSIHHQLKTYSRAIALNAAGTLFPAHCHSCGVPVDHAQLICPDCLNAMHMLGDPMCIQCAEPFDYAIDGQERCDTCLRDPPAFDAAYALWRYDEYSSKLIKQFKFLDKTHLAEYFGRILALQGTRLLRPADMITPIPLHYKRLRARRYNQSMLLAQSIARHSEVPAIPNLLVRVKHTTPQTELSYSERASNIAGAFTIHPRHRAQLEGARVVVVDDVMTTGATLNAAAHTLKSAGVAWVGVLCVAKRLREQQQAWDGEAA